MAVVMLYVENVPLITMDEVSDFYSLPVMSKYYLKLWQTVLWLHIFLLRSRAEMHLKFT